MKILVCVKQVPDTTEVKLDPRTNTLIREGLPSIINPDDKAAIEEALKIKDKTGAEIILLSMGPAQADYALREGLAMGADRAILLSSRAFGGADTWATSLTIAEAIKRIPEIDIIFCGRQAIDGDTAQVGPEIAEHLNIPQITYVKKITSLTDKSITAERALEDGYEVIEATLPVVLTTIKEANTPRLATMNGIIRAFDEQQVELWDENKISIPVERLGLKGSPTKVKKSFAPPMKAPGHMVEGLNDKEKIRILVSHLLEKNLI